MTQLAGDKVLLGDLPKVGDKLPAGRFGPFDHPRLQRYASASGDDNPIHLDADLARQAGLAAPPVHGMLLMSCFEPAIATWRPDLVLMRLSAKFLRPVLAGESVEIAGRVVEVDREGRHVLMRLLAHNERREIVIIAEAMLAKATAD